MQYNQTTMIPFKLAFYTSFLLLGQYLDLFSSVDGRIDGFNKEIISKDMNMTKGKPIIYTYVSQSVDNIEDLIAKDELLKIWTECWSNAGWDPRILTAKDAREHPDYENIIDALSTAGVNNGRWYRYLRYIAMSIRGGGWYSDLSILPLSSYKGNLEDPLPNEGKFTIHEVNAVPEFMSGNRKEWSKMLKEMMSEPNNNDINLIKLLMKKDPELILVEDSITSSIHLLRPTTLDVCALVLSDKVVAAKYEYRISQKAKIPRRKYYETVHSSLTSINNKCNNKIERPFANEKQVEITNKNEAYLNNNEPDYNEINNKIERTFVHEKQVEITNKNEAYLNNNEPDYNEINNKIERPSANEKQVEITNKNEAYLNNNEPDYNEISTIGEENQLQEQMIPEHSGNNQEYRQEEQRYEIQSHTKRRVEVIGTKQNPSAEQPVMHTFFEPAYGKYDNLVVELGVWEKAWTDAGWKTSVLTLKDAQRHPYFKRFKRTFDNAKYKVDDYNRMCFYRWLAMAASGGGWMSDVSCISIK